VERLWNGCGTESNLRRPTMLHCVFRYSFSVSSTPATRGLHSFTFHLNVSAFHGIWGAFRGCLRGVYQVSGGVRVRKGCVLVS